jgi:HAE1 family hydrophobic/amphiphilic exporter-1
MEAALNEVRSKVDTTLDDIPREAERPLVQKIDTASEPVVTMAVSSPTLSNRQLRDLIDRTIKDRLSRLEGVSAVGVSGGELREIQVQLKRDALLQYGVGILDIQRAIQNAALNVPAGRVVDGAEEYTVRMIGDFSRIEDLADMYLTVTDGRGPQGVSKSVRLGDVATVLDTSQEVRTNSRLNGKDAVIMIVQKSKEGNAVEISEALRKPGPNGAPSLLDQLSKQYNITFQITLDVSKTIEESIGDLTFSIAFGVVLVTLVVWLFLHNIRGTLIVAIAIPLCIFASLAAYWIFGFTINNLSMLALSLAVGVLVDDAIVIIENTYRHLTMGEDPEEAAINGRAELGTAAIAITLADVVVFFPIGVMGGVTGQFFKPLGLGYVVCVLFSLLVSFTVTPMLAAKWYRKGEDWEHPQGRFARWFEGGFSKFANAYGRGVAWALRNRWSVFSGGFAILIATFLFIGGSNEPKETGFFGSAMIGSTAAMISFGLGLLAFALSPLFGRFKPGWLLMGAVWGLVIMAGPAAGWLYCHEYKKETVFKFAFFPVTDTGRVSVNIDLPPGSSLAETEQAVQRMEKIVMAHPMVEFTVANVGTRGGGGFESVNQATNFAAITATLYEKEALMDKLKFWEKHEGKLRPMGVSAERVAGDLTESIGKVAGVKLSISQATEFGFGSAVQISLQSTDRELLQQTAAKIRDGLAAGKIPGVINPDLSTKPGKPELQARPDRAKLADYDLSAGQVGLALRTMYEGDENAKFRVKGEEYDIRVMLDLEDRNNPALLDNVPVTFQSNKPIYLSDVATVTRGQGLDRIDRRNRLEEVVVQADLLPGVSFGPINDQIGQWVKDESLIPDGVIYDPVGQARVQQREFPILIGTFLTGIVLVYMVLAALYNNLIYPFIIQLAQPQALVGALLALIITDKALNVVGFIGIVALVGLVGKNAILLVDYANTLRNRGEDRDEAVIHSGRTRLRPILMTTIALIVGTLPVALAIGRGSEFRETIGITIIGGATLSTILTLFVIPCSYTIFDDLMAGGGKLWRKVFPAGEPAAVQVDD